MGAEMIKEEQERCIFKLPTTFEFVELKTSLQISARIKKAEIRKIFCPSFFSNSLADIFPES
jgi:hypothetical protein